MGGALASGAFARVLRFRAARRLEAIVGAIDAERKVFLRNHAKIDNAREIRQDR